MRHSRVFFVLSLILVFLFSMQMRPALAGELQMIQGEELILVDDLTENDTEGITENNLENGGDADESAEDEKLTANEEFDELSADLQNEEPLIEANNVEQNGNTGVENPNGEMLGDEVPTNGWTEESGMSANNEIVIDSVECADVEEVSEMQLPVSVAYTSANTSSDVAINVGVNASYTDNMLNKSDVNWYKFTTLGDGYISLSFSPDYIAESTKYWNAYLYDSNMTGLASYTFAATTSYEQGDIGIPAGTYYVKIENVYGRYTDTNYTIKINYTESNAWETEFNNSSATADLISVNNSCSGSIGIGGDVDWYKFTLPNPGYISLDYAPEYVTSSTEYWNVYLYDSSMMGLATYSFTATTSYKQGDIGIPAGTYYVKIENVYGRYTDTNYAITINYTESNVWETEFNNSSATADLISINNSCSGSMGIDGDVDWYKFTLSDSGYISLDYTPEHITSSTEYWNVYLYDSGMTGLASYTFAATTSYEQGDIGVPAGTYYVKIENVYGRYTDTNYTIKINYTESNAWETEFNNSSATADLISVNNSCNGSIGIGGDVDWYKFTLPNSGYISLDYAPEYVASSIEYWNVYLCDSSMTELAAYSFAATTSYEQGDIGIPAGTYYVKIENVYGRYTDTNYTIRINYTESNVWETEFNNSVDTADTLNVDSLCNGSLGSKSDVDWYKFTLASAGKHVLYLNHDYVSFDKTLWELYLYDSSMSELSHYSYNGSTKSFSHNINLLKGVYYIKIVSAYGYYSDTNYDLKIGTHIHDYKDSVVKATTSQNGSIVKICSCGAEKDRMTIYYPKKITLSKSKYAYDGKEKKPSVTVTGSDGKIIDSKNYDIQYASGRMNVGIYEIKIKFKGNYSGTVIKTFTISPEATNLTSLFAKRKGFTVKWKRRTKQIDGYQIQYSTSRNFTGKKTKTISKSKTSATYKGLKSGKKYYVRIRTYKKVSGKKYYSSWSSVKKVKIK